MNHKNLSVELRPRRLSEMIGQERLVNDIRNQFGKGQVPLSILLTGEYGAGKTTLAGILALSFNCLHQTTFGEPCDMCLDNEEMFSIQVRNCAQLTTKDETIDFLSTLRSYPQFGNYRIIILDEMQQMSAAAQQTILKELENTDSVNVFIIGTTNPEKINQGIKDRSQSFPIPELTPAGVHALVANTMELAESRFDIAPRDIEPLAAVLSQARIFSSRNVVMATDQYLAGKSPEAACTIKEAGEVDFYNLYRFLGTGNWDSAREILMKAKPTEASAIKMRMSSFFRDALLKSPSGSRAVLLSSFIEEIGKASAVESGLELSMVIAVCYQITQRVNEAVETKKRDASQAGPIPKLARAA
jgi:hypothetical protein